MKEYKGAGGSALTIDGDNLFIKQMFAKENCTFSDITQLEFKEPALGGQRGSITIKTIGSPSAPYMIFFSKADRDKFAELFDELKAKVPEPEDHENVQDAVVYLKEDDQAAHCPKCGSTSITAVATSKSKYKIGKALTGVMLFGGLGLLAGNSTKTEVKVVCMKCGRTFSLRKMR